jgi:hypothetical protein
MFASYCRFAFRARKFPFLHRVSRPQVPCGRETQSNGF